MSPQSSERPGSAGVSSAAPRIEAVGYPSRKRLSSKLHAAVVALSLACLIFTTMGFLSTALVGVGMHLLGMPKNAIVVVSGLVGSVALVASCRVGVGAWRRETDDV